jgi:hypothetical protein
MPEPLEYQNKSIQTTEIVSYEETKRKNLNASQLLQLLAYLDCRDI